MTIDVNELSTITKPNSKKLAGIVTLKKNRVSRIITTKPNCFVLRKKKHYLTNLKIQ